MNNTKKRFQDETVRWGILIFSIIIILIIFESLLRLEYIGNHNALLSKYKGRELLFKKDPALLYVAISSKNGFNSHGYYDYEHEFLKPSNIFRIVIIGDSIAAGQGVSLDESFGKVLEKKLNAVSHKKSEIIILAMSGYSISQELILLKDQAFKYSPDLIVWSYALNDPTHPIFHDANGEMGRFFSEPKIHLLSFIAKRLFYFKEKIKAKFLHCENAGYYIFMHCVYWDQVKLNIKTIDNVCREKKIPIIFLIHPIFEKNKTFSEYSLIALHDKLKNLALEYNLMPLDLLKAYKNYSSEELSQVNDEWHPNAKGHKIVAEYIYLNLMKNGY